jgi:hypothetical protein
MSTRVLDPVERVSEMCFGLFMALTFVGAVSALGGTDAPRTMFAAALGCNLAWGFVDAVMYLVRTITERGREITLAKLPGRPRFRKDDFVGALGIFLIVVATTFPIALPFVVIADGKLALIVSRGLTLAMLFAGGLALGRHSGFGGWKAGFAMMLVGVVVTVIVIALGG